jgi:hypothetical protein
MARRPFPADGPAWQGNEAAARTDRPSGVRRLFTRAILPLILFVAVVAGIAWVTQYLPSWRRSPQLPPPSGPAAIQFDQQGSVVWDPADKDYVAEFEFAKEGHYDFPFVNTASTPAELGLSDTSCGCSNVKVCVLSSAEQDAFKGGKLDMESIHWEALPRDEDKGLVVPPKARGVVRLIWRVRKINAKSTLTIKLWSRAEGRSRDPEIKLDTPVVFVMPVRFSPSIKDFGTLGPHGVGRAEFVFWSSTRDHFDLHLKGLKEDPCFVCRVTPLSLPQCREVAEQLKERGFYTRVKAAYRVDVEVREESNGRQLDLGPFQRNLPVVTDDPVTGEMTGPVLKGRVRGDITVDTEDGHIDLKNFAVNSARERRVPVWTDAGVPLALDAVPDFLRAKLTPKTTFNGKTRWELRVTTRPGALLPGGMPEDSAIILRATGTSPRRIRVPVVGNAVQG